MLNSAKAVALAMTLMVGSGCAGRVPAPTFKTPGEPHVSWIIMFGDQDDPNREFACQSEPRTDCVMPPSRADAPVVSLVYFYYHGVHAEAKYTGAIKIGFFQGSGGQVEPSVTVGSGDEIVNQSVSGIVTSTAGSYEMSLAVVAASGGNNRPLNDRVSIVVK